MVSSALLFFCERLFHIFAYFLMDLCLAALRVVYTYFYIISVHEEVKKKCESSFILQISLSYLATMGNVGSGRIAYIMCIYIYTHDFELWRCELRKGKCLPSDFVPGGLGGEWPGHCICQWRLAGGGCWTNCSSLLLSRRMKKDTYHPLFLFSFVNAFKLVAKHCQPARLHKTAERHAKRHYMCAIARTLLSLVDAVLAQHAFVLLALEHFFFLQACL